MKEIFENRSPMSRFQINDKETNTLEFFLYTLYILLGIISTAGCLINRESEIYQNLFMLPLGYTVINLLFFRNAKGMLSNYARGIIIGVCFMKGIFTPLLLSIGGYETFFYRITKEGVDFAIALLLYEYVCVSLYINFHKNKGVSHGFRIKIAKKYNFGKSIILAVIIFCALSYLVLPELRASFMPIFSLSRVVSLDGNTSIPIGIRRVFYTLATMLFPIALTYASSLMVFVARRRGEGFGSLFAACFSIVILLFFVSEETGYFVICTLVVFLLIFQLYPSKRKILFGIGGGMFVLAIVAVYFAKLATVSGTTGTGMMGRMFQAYFPGVSNTAGIYKYTGVESKVTQWFYELYNGIPFKTTLFGKIYDRLVIDYCNYNGTIYQIIPLTAQAYYFYGFILAPIDALLLTKISLESYNKAQNSKNVFMFCTYIFIAIYAGVTIGMYNMTTFFSKTLNVFLPMLIIMRFTDDEKCSFESLLR